jgi:GntR family transcriptional regulator
MPLNHVTSRIRLDMRSEVPIYIQIVDQVRQMIARDELVPGDQLPTVRELATELKVNWNTVARAYRILDEARLISTQRGRGTYVWEKLSDEANLKIRQEGIIGLAQRYLCEAAEQGYSPEEAEETFARLLKEWKDGKPPTRTE